MNGVILTSYFTKKKHPNHHQDLDVVGRNDKGFVDNNNFNYIKKWYNSVIKLKLNGVVFHDDLSEDFVDKYTNQYIKFEKVGESNWSNNDYRFYCWRDYLRDKDYDWVFHNDVSDVVVVKDPTGLIKNHSEYKYFVCKDNFPLEGPAFTYLRVAEIAKLEGQYWFLMNSQLPLLNMGVVGGKLEDMKNFYEKFCEVRDSAQPCPPIGFDGNGIPDPYFNMNMWVGNNVLRYHIQEKILLGQPVTSKYKKYENDRKDVYFIHK